MRRYVAQGKERWHTPGHKGQSPDKEGLALPWSWDVTEVGDLQRTGGDDDPVLRSETLLAEQLGVERSWFSVQGASLPVMAAILAAFPPGSTVAVERHAHRSVLSALIVGDLYPHWIGTRHSDDGRVLPATEADWQEALNGEVAGLVLTRPTYDGLALFDEGTARIIAHAHAKGLSVVVDEAHGSHFPGRQGFPRSAINLGADLVAHGVHKTEPSLTQTGVLHLQGGRVTSKAVDWWWGLLGTSSPSYILLASLDQWQTLRGKAEISAAWTRLAADVRRLWDDLSQSGYAVWQVEAERDFGLAVDPSKLSLRGPGPELAHDLAQIGYVEKVEAGLVTLFFSPGQSLSGLRRKLEQGKAISPHQDHPLTAAPGLPLSVLSPRAAAMGGLEWLPLRQCVGRIAARSLVPYPPGSPWIVPGERFSSDLVGKILQSRERLERAWEGGQVIKGELWIGVVQT